MHRRAFLAGVATAGTAGCTALATGGDYDVGMTSGAFDPAEVTVEVGTEVVWKNTSSRAHTVTAYGASIPEGADYFASGGYDSQAAAFDAWDRTSGGAIYGSETFSHTFEVAGTYRYVCIPHRRSGMNGRVEVVEK